MVVASNENRLLNLSKIEVTGLAGISITLGKMDYVSPTDHRRDPSISHISLKESLGL